MKGSIGPMLHLGQWMIDVEVDKGPWPAAAAPILPKRVAFAFAQEELTQDFFLMMLEGDILKRADPSRGRMRSLLLKAVQNS